MARMNDTTAGKPSKHFADGVERDCVVIISELKEFYVACWGKLMSTRAQYLGAQGVVIDGNFTDINEHSARFPGDCLWIPDSGDAR